MILWRADRTLVDPPLADDVDAFAASDAATWTVDRLTGGFRSRARQLALYHQGRTDHEVAARTHLTIGVGGVVTNAPPESAPHCYVDEGGRPCAQAVDVVPLDDDRGRPIWDDDAAPYRRLRAYVDAHPRLHGGWSFGDGDHVQTVRWPALRAAAMAAP
jgi:hypothetical protein